MSEAIILLTKSLLEAGIAEDHHLIVWTPTLIPSRQKGTIPGWLLQLSDKRDGSTTRFTLCGQAVDTTQRIIHFPYLLDVQDPGRAAVIVVAAIELGAILSIDGVVESAYSPNPN